MGVKLRWKPLKGGKQSAYLDIYFNGERSYEFLDIKINPRDPDSKEQKELAKQIRAQRENQILNEFHGFEPKAYQKANFIEYFQSFVDNYKKPGIRKYRYSLEWFKRYIGTERLPFNKLTPEICLGFRDFLYDPRNGLTGETPYDYFKRFTAVVNNAVRENILRESPAKLIRVRREQNMIKKQVLTSKELKTLAQTECGNEEVKRAFLFACLTGLGLAEIRKLKWGDIREGRILILAREKTNKPITNPLSNDAIALLGKPGNSDQKIFKLPSGTAVNKSIQYWVSRASIPKHITFYCGRHTFATLLLIHGKSHPKTLADMLGQSSLQYVSKYLNYIDKQ